jgi:translation initiation factor 3 subunit A
MATFAKPENALKRAEELMNVGQKQAALQALHDLITSKRYRAWQKTLERIMFKYVELCVDMKKGRFAKDGLIQYRIVCQQVNVSSLEEVIKYFLQLSSERAEAAQAQAAAAEVTLDVEDLEAEKRPEDLMLSYVSGEKGKERSDRETVTPWFKFLWETYRTTLEILRNNSKLESLYAMTAHRAFQFCLQYKRTTEFRRLCEILRNHLTNLNKYRDQRDRPDLTQPESLQLYLETRFEQLKIATELELWQEAFRSIEDIHGLMSMVKRTPKPQMMAIYYAKLTQIYWVSDSHLYHAYAWYKLYNLQKSYNKNLTAKDMQLMASSVVLATLAVTPYDRKHGAHHFELEMEKDRNIRMANILGFNLDAKKDSREVLSRAALLAELVSKGVMTYVSPEVKDLYGLLENEFHPLDLAAKVQPVLSKLPSLSDKLSSASPVPEVHLEQYNVALERLTTLRVLQQASHVYSTIKISEITRMITFFDFSIIEKLIVEAVKYNFVQMKVDHLKEVVNFGSQDLESEKVKNHLTILAKRLNKACLMISPPTFERPSKQVLPFDELQAVVEKEHKKLLARKVLIERRKEEQERQMLEMEREEESKRLKQQRLTEEAEAKRLQNESARREEARIRKEIEEKELEEARALLAEAEKRKGKKGKKGALPVDGEVTKLTKQLLMEEALSEQMKERQEMERKLQKLSKTMDHLERAKREEERPLIEEAYRKRLRDDESFYQQQQEQAIEQSKKQHETDVIEKNRLIRMAADKEVFQLQVVSRRKGEFERLKRLREERLAEERAMRSQEREIRRKKEYFKRLEEQRLLKIQEEEEAKKKEEEERKRKEDAERRAKLEEMAAKQRQAEIAAEEREKREREEALRARLDDKPGKFIPPSLRKRMENGEDVRRDDRRDTRPPMEERRPLFGRPGLVASRETDRQVDGEGDAPPAPAPSSNRYQPPRARQPDSDGPPPGAYQPPVRRTYDAPGARGDAYEPPRSGAYAPPGRPGSRPLGQRPTVGGEDRPERPRW